jgi:anaerobic glycerol-3-phosphate dehydrogenase
MLLVLLAQEVGACASAPWSHWQAGPGSFSSAWLVEVQVRSAPVTKAAGKVSIVAIRSMLDLGPQWYNHKLLPCMHVKVKCTLM